MPGALEVFALVLVGIIFVGSAITAAYDLLTERCGEPE